MVSVGYGLVMMSKSARTEPARAAVRMNLESIVARTLTIGCFVVIVGSGIWDICKVGDRTPECWSHSLQTIWIIVAHHKSLTLHRSSSYADLISGLEAQCGFPSELDSHLGAKLLQPQEPDG